MSLLLRAAAFVLLMPGTVGVWFPWRLLTGRWLAPPGAPHGWGAPQAAGLAALGGGAALFFWCLWDFVTTARSAPVPMDPARRLVVRGPYRWCRNPMYLGVLTVIAGWALLYEARALAVYGAAVALAFHLFVLLQEEPDLRRRFGAEYDAYCAAVRRWLPGRPVGPAA